MSAQTVAVLFARTDSVYKQIEGCDVWDIERDARKWPGGSPLVAHPPCRLWGRMRQWSIANRNEMWLATFAVDLVRWWGGALEHPAHSTLWRWRGLPPPGGFQDEFGGFTVEVDQWRFGHRAPKLTWVYVVGCRDLPPTPTREGKPTHCIRATKKFPRLPYVTKREREATPRLFAEWLVEIARRSAAEPREQFA